MRKLIRYDEQHAQEQKGRRGKIPKDRIEALTSSIPYRIPSDLVADCIIRETLGMFAASRLYSGDGNLQSHKTSARERGQSTQTQPSESSRNYRPTG